MVLPPQTGYPPTIPQYGYPGYLGYECQQTPYRIPAVFEENKKRNIDEVVSPTQVGKGEIMEKRIQNQSPTTVIDLDTRAILTPRADDTAILSAMNNLCMEVSTNLKAHDIKNLATKEDIVQITQRLDGYAKEVAELKETFEQQKTELQQVTELSNRNVASIMYLGQCESRPEREVTHPQRDQHGDPHTRTIQNNTSTKRINLVIEGVSTDKDVCAEKFD